MFIYILTSDRSKQYSGFSAFMYKALWFPNVNTVKMPDFRDGNSRDDLWKVALNIEIGASMSAFIFYFICFRVKIPYFFLQPSECFQECHIGLHYFLIRRVTAPVQQLHLSITARSLSKTSNTSFLWQTAF